MKKHLLSVTFLGVMTSFLLSQCTTNPLTKSSSSGNESDTYTVTLSIDSSLESKTDNSGSTKDNPFTVIFKTAFDADKSFGHDGDDDSRDNNHEEIEQSHHHEFDASEDGNHSKIDDIDDIHHFHDTIEDFQHHHSEEEVSHHNPNGVKQGHHHSAMPSEYSHHHDYTYMGAHEISGMKFILEAIKVVPNEKNGEGTYLSREENMIQILLAVEEESDDVEALNGFVYTVSIRNNESGDVTEKVLTPAYGLNGIHHMTDIELPQSHEHETGGLGMMGGNHHH